MEIKAVIFDMDGTLVDSEPLWHKAEIKEFGEVGVHLTVEECLKTTGVRLDQVVQQRFDEQPWEGVSVPQVVDRIIERMKLVIASEGEAKPGAIEAVNYFAEKKMPLALASASYLTLIETTLARLGITEAFSVVHSAQFEERGKPDPAVYLTAARKLGVAPGNCLAFEDSLSGIRAAKAAGMTCVAVKEGSTPFEEAVKLADYSLESLGDLRNALWLTELLTFSKPF